jgi:hypothetical protein
MVRPDRDWLADRRRARAEAGPVRPPTAAEAAAEKTAGARAAAASTRPAGRPSTVPKAPIPQRAYQGTVDIAFNGSALDSPPYQLRPDRPEARRPYQRQTYGMSLSGPLRLPGVYEGGRRTTMAVTYSGNRGTSLFDEYATVPTDAIRAGDFSSVSAPHHPELPLHDDQRLALECDHDAGHAPVSAGAARQPATGRAHRGVTRGSGADPA